MRTYLWFCHPASPWSSVASLSSVDVGRKYWNLVLDVVQRHKPPFVSKIPGIWGGLGGRILPSLRANPPLSLEWEGRRAGRRERPQLGAILFGDTVAIGY